MKVIPQRVIGPYIYDRVVNVTKKVTLRKKIKVTVNRKDTLSLKIKMCVIS